MDATYNKVIPVTLGKSRKKAKTMKANKMGMAVREDLAVPAPPSFPPPSLPPAPPPLSSQEPSMSKIVASNGEGGLYNERSNPFTLNAPPSSFQEPFQFWNNSVAISNNPSIQGFQGIPMMQQIGSNSTGRIPKPSSSGTITNNSGIPSERGAKASNNTRKKKKTRPNQSMDIVGADSMSLTEEAERRRKRAERFANTSNSVSSTSLDGEENFANLNAISTKSHRFDKDKSIVGRCQSLEKSYLRLTSEPNPDLVRPLNVLKKAYAMLMRKYQKKQTSYQYLCDQFKSMRQDLRVQMIENQFTIKVYESHARIALENGDLGEFNQCQSRLITLFELPTIKPSFLEEFTSYRILYYMLTDDNGSMNTLRLKLMTESHAIFKNHMVKTAFELAHARLMGNYHRFMKIYSSMESLGKTLVDAFIDKEKLKSLVVICKSYNQIGLDFLMQEFQMSDSKELMEFFKQRGLDKYILTKNSGEENESQYLDTKACRVHVMQQYFSSKKIDIKGQR